ncbi:polysaccharide lyase family 7 protein [Aurantiacibacter aquimixticola]|uniref:polysaccharide lyase family 7 protein n=1 Tax=Aurantiacibacter aquimixticola TaxID=1958945 RepID=UPI0018F884EB|nr:polysaccharide lyase family 7 protein [Aurantiacibacter aquimixticola]
MKSLLLKSAITSLALLGLSTSGYAVSSDDPAPGELFDLSYWKITLPMDEDGDGKPDEVDVRDIQDYSHPDYFYVDDAGRMVFTAPNRAITTANSTNTRSELRQMLRGTNTRIGTHSGGNNFAVAARRDSDRYGMVGGRMQATLSVDHVALNAANPDRKPAYSVVVGQIHSVKYDDTSSGFGYGNEPIKIYYKKWPGHDYGSVFWTYERNLARGDEDRIDIPVPVFGNLWDDGDDPGEAGIALGEEFSYEINVHGNTMYVTFYNARHGYVGQAVSLIEGVDALDNPLGYGGDSLYFKAGAYNQCSTRSEAGFWYAGCGGTGDWATDYANGDYARVSFSRLEVGPSVPFVDPTQADAEDAD